MGRYSGKKCRLISMFWLTMSFFLVEIIVGYATNSMALVADSFHMLSDIAALVVAFLSVKVSPRKWSKNTFGWARAEVLGALVNAVFLAAMCFSISVEAVKRIVKVEPVIQPKLVVIVGSLGLLVNIVGLFLFHEHGSSSFHAHNHVPLAKPGSRLNHIIVTTDESEADDTLCTTKVVETKGNDDSNKQRSQSAAHMNMRGIFLHVLADAMGSLIVILSASIIWLTDWPYKGYLDPGLSLLMIILILRSLWPLLRESSLILLQTVPTHIQVDEIEKKLLLNIDGLLGVHEFHVWQLAGDRIIASAHIRCRNLADYMKIAEDVKKLFHNEGIHSTTIQPEFIEVGNEIDPQPNEDCVLDCPKTNQCCTFFTCCGPSKQDKEEDFPDEAEHLCRQRLSSSLSMTQNRSQIS